MPTFKTQKPRGITAAVTAALDSSPDLSGSEIMKAALMRSQVDQHDALAEKARFEVEQARAADAARRDPNKAIEMGVFATPGLTMPTARDFYSYKRGDQVQQPVTMDDEGNELPAPGAYARPESVSPEQERQFSSHIVAALQNELATGKTNAHQLQQAASGNLLDQVRVAAAALPGAADQNQALAPWRDRAREPFAQNAAGTSVLNQEVGTAATPSTPAATAGVADIVAHTRLRDAQAAAALALERKRAGGGGGAGGGEGGNAAQAFLRLTGAKLSSLGQEARTQWMQNHAAGMDPAENLKTLTNKSKDGKPLPAKTVSDVAAAGTAVEDSARLAGTFKPEYGGKTVLGDLSNTYKRVMGDTTGQAQWWQDMDTLQNQTRHALFGSALTATELKAWEKTSVTPRMDPDQITANLKRRQEIEARAASKLARAWAAGGYSQTQIRELLGNAAGYLDNPAPPVGAGASGGWGGPGAAPGGAKRVVVDY